MDKYLGYGRMRQPVTGLGSATVPVAAGTRLAPPLTQANGVFAGTPNNGGRDARGPKRTAEKLKPKRGLGSCVSLEFRR